jgi:hypothetical protein
MSDNVFDLLKKDAKNASYKLVAVKSAELLKNSIVSIVERKTDSDKARSFAKFLDTDVGLSFINILMGVIIESVPQIKENKNSSRLGEEFRVNGMSIAGNAAFDKVFSDLLPQVMSVITSLPEEKVRVLPEASKSVSLDCEEVPSTVVSKRKVR